MDRHHATDAAPGHPPVLTAAAAPPFPGPEELLRRSRWSDHDLIELLHAAQERYGWLSPALLGHVADSLSLPPALVFGVASFYHEFRLAPPGRRICSVCTGTSCHLRGGSRLLADLEQYCGLTCGETAPDGSLSLEQVRCLGACGRAPLVRICGNGSVTHHGPVDTPYMTTVLGQEGGSAAATGEEITPVSVTEAPGAGIILGDCLANGTAPVPFRPYRELERTVKERTPAEVCRIMSDSGLRGRGGAGYPTGRKWDLVREAGGSRVFVVANGDEGDPGAFMDRTLMEYDPHRILEGMAIAAFAVGARYGFIYVRAEYPAAAARLREAVREAGAAGSLGHSLFGSSFSFTVRVRSGAGAYVCGEETALIASIMGRRGQPVIRPPYPARRGVWGFPTLINNVETFGNVTAVMAGGAAAYRACGTRSAGGTKLFSVSGDVARVGVYEVPLGTTMGELLALAGGTVGGAFKAAQTGGAGGGCITADHLDLPLDYDHPAELGAMIGSGGIVVLNDSRCMVDLARFFMRFCCDESCGACVPCRAGTAQAQRILDRICCGTGTEGDINRLEELCRLLRLGSLCGLGRGAAAPVTGTLRWYRHEYLAHIHQGCCPVGVCRKEGPA